MTFVLFLSDGVLKEDRGLPEPVGHRHQGSGSDLPAGAGTRRLRASEDGTCSEGEQRSTFTDTRADIWFGPVLSQ